MYLGEKSNTRDELVTKIGQAAIIVNNDLASIQWMEACLFEYKEIRGDHFEQFVLKIDKEHFSVLSYFGVLFLKEKACTKLDDMNGKRNCYICIYVLLHL